MYYEKKSNKVSFLAIPSPSKPTLHLHNEIEILINMHQDAKTYVYINSKKYLLNYEDAIIIMPGQIHTTEPIHEGLFLLFTFPAEYIPRLCNFLQNKVPENPVFNLRETDTHHILYEFWTLHDKVCKMEQPHIASSLIIGYMNVILSQLCYKLKFTDISTDISICNRVIKHLSENYTENVTLTELSKKMNISPTAISKIFNSSTGITIPSFINWLRVSAAADMLTSTKDNITEISGKVGFGTIRNFNRSFLEIFGVTPSNYRELHK